jgi:hypothetical protein
MIDARGIACAVSLKPFEYVSVQTHGDQFLWRATKLGELLVGESRNIGIVDPRSGCAFLPPRHVF